MKLGSKPGSKLCLASLMVLAQAAVAFAEEASHGGAEAPASPFAGTIYQSAAAVLVFVILLVLLRKYAWAPILKGLQDRENKIRTDLHNAESAAKKAATTLADYQRQLAEAKQQSAEIMENGRREAEKVAARIQSETQAEIDAMKKRATAEIGFAKEQALADIFSQAATLGSDIAGKILRREINPADQQRLVQESLATLKKEDLN